MLFPTTLSSTVKALSNLNGTSPLVMTVKLLNSAVSGLNDATTMLRSQIDALQIANETAAARIRLISVLISTSGLTLPVTQCRALAADAATVASEGVVKPLCWC
jgi:diacylglycerol kinase